MAWTDPTGLGTFIHDEAGGGVVGVVVGSRVEMDTTTTWLDVIKLYKMHTRVWMTTGTERGARRKEWMRLTE